jgi:hypothetical protein
MSPTISCLRAGATAAADMPATRRSILRYLARYERDWGQDEVAMPAWHFVMCRPPEEDEKWLVKGRVHVALGQLRENGLLEKKGTQWVLTDLGREVGKGLLLTEVDRAA